MPDPVATAASPSLFEQLAVGDTQSLATEPVTIVIFGGSGDLAHRKLLPALYNLHVDGVLPPRIAIVGAGRMPATDGEYRAFARDGIARFSRRPIDEPAWQTFAENLFAVNVELDQERGMAPLGARLDIIEHERGLTGNRIYYLAIPPTLFAPTVEQLQRGRFVVKSDLGAGAPGVVGAARPFARLIVEKPIGRDLESARAVND